MIQAKAQLVYRSVLIVWIMVLFWQGLEHHRFKEGLRGTVVRRARDISNTLGLVIRSQRRFAMVSKPRLESALKELVQSDELKSVLLLNANRDVVVSAGEPVDLGAAGMPQSGVYWDKHRVTIINLVDLGANLQQDGTNTTPTPTIVIPEPEPGQHRENWRFPPPGGRSRRLESTNDSNQASSNNTTIAREQAALTNSPPPPRFEERGRPPGPRPGFGRPPWMSKEDFEALLEQKGVHGLAIAMSTDAFEAARIRDLWLRTMIGGFAAIAGIGFSFAWRTFMKSSDFQVRLVRASEQNSHLREMNVAAAGLAHETRNPLNIIRGLAQMISTQKDASLEVRKKTSEILTEVDRVAAQLTEFINYSRPREVRITPIALDSVINDVARALQSDLEFKSIKYHTIGDKVAVEADEALLRQVIFNLLLNAIQAVDGQGEICITTGLADAGEAFLEFRDNGPGVAPEHRSEIFKPYFTTQQKGTGLGLAVVRQIVLAHGWEIQYLPNEPKGAIFRLNKVKLAKV